MFLTVSLSQPQRFYEKGSYTQKSVCNKPKDSKRLSLLRHISPSASLKKTSRMIYCNSVIKPIMMCARTVSRESAAYAETGRTYYS